MTRVTRTAVTRTCAICERTLLMGERVMRFAPNAGADLVDVCPLCQEEALESGWLKEGAPSMPFVSDDRRRSPLARRTIFGAGRPAAEEPVASEPILRRLSNEELELV